MKLLITRPFSGNIAEIKELINKSNIPVETEHSEEKTSSIQYSLDNNKIFFTNSSPVTLSDVKAELEKWKKLKTEWKTGNEITKCKINGILCNIFVFHKGSNLNDKLISDIESFISQENLKIE